MKGCSVIICTYNGSSLLPETLKHLARQSIDVPWELIVVDNNSTEDPLQISERCWEAFGNPAPLIVLKQPIAGKSHALTLGMQHAKYDYIVICDNDNWLPPDYLQIGFSIMEIHPDYGILGGRAEAVADIVIPEWFYEVQYAYACGSPANVSVDLTGRYYLWGAGTFIRNRVAKIILHQDHPLLMTGRRGALLTAGEDDEKCARCWLAGYKTYFDYRLFFKHFMPALRLTPEYRDELLAGFSEQGEVLGSYRRLMYAGEKKRRNLEIVKQWLAWMRAKVLRNPTDERIARDYLFFLVKTKRWETPINSRVQAFFDFTQKQLF